MTLGYYQYSKEEIEHRLSEAMRITCDALLEQGILTTEQHGAFLDNHTLVIVTKQSVISRLRALLFSDPAQDGGAFLVKIICK